MTRPVNFPALIFVLAALSAMATSFWTPASMPISRTSGRLLGMLIFLIGMTLFTWAGLCLKEAFFGNVEPVGERIVTDGPYRRVRHPLYLSMVISLIGVGLMLRSSWGVFSVFALFLPAVVYRARLEEQALEKKFGPIWRGYATETLFLVPFLW